MTLGDVRSDGPTLSVDPQQWRRDLADHGLCMVADALSPAELESVRSRLYEAAATDIEEGRGYVYDHGETNQRVWALLKRGEEFVELAVIPSSSS